MSGKATGKVWDLKLSPAKQSVLLALADHADHDGGNIFPGVPLVAWKTGYSERQTYRIMGELEADGILVAVTRQEGKPTIYKIDFTKGELKAPFKSRKERKTTDKMTGVEQTTDKMTPLTSQGENESQTPDIASAKTSSILKDQPSLNAFKDSGAPVGTPQAAGHIAPKKTAAKVAARLQEQQQAAKSIPAPQATPAPAKEREANPMFDAVARYVFGITDKAELKEMGRGNARIQMIAQWLKRERDAFKYGKSASKFVGFIGHPATPDSLRRFAADWEEEHEGITMPQDAEKFVNAWRRWVSEQRAEMGAEEGEEQTRSGEADRLLNTKQRYLAERERVGKMQVVQSYEASRRRAERDGVPYKYTQAQIEQMAGKLGTNLFELGFEDVAPIPQGAL